MASETPRREAPLFRRNNPEELIMTTPNLKNVIGRMINDYVSKFKKETESKINAYINTKVNEISLIGDRYISKLESSSGQVQMQIEALQKQIIESAKTQKALEDRMAKQAETIKEREEEIDALTIKLIQISEMAGSLQEAQKIQDSADANKQLIQMMHELMEKVK